MARILNKKVTDKVPYEVMYDPSYVFQTGGRFSHLEFEHGLDHGIWPNHMIVKRLGTGQYYQVKQLRHNLGSHAKAIQVIHGMKRHRAADPEILGARDEYRFWTIDQLIDEILRLAKLTEEKEKADV